MIKYFLNYIKLKKKKINGNGKLEHGLRAVDITHKKRYQDGKRQRNYCNVKHPSPDVESTTDFIHIHTANVY